MTADEYIYGIISKYLSPTGAGTAAYNAGQALYATIKSWAGSYLLAVNFSGSYAKQTAIKGSTDVDLFISLNPQMPGTLKQIYDALYSHFVRLDYSCRKQNVSIGLKHRGVSVDLVPARKQPGNTNDHSLFRNKTQTWIQTNIQNHIDKVLQCGRLNEIRATKIWRNLNHLDFPSFYLELTVIDAVHGKRKDDLANNFCVVLEYLTDSFPTARVVDPSNSNNVISDELTTREKAAISVAAKNSRNQANWEQIIW
jgi:hypothetical protein